VLRI